MWFHLNNMLESIRWCQRTFECCPETEETNEVLTKVSKRLIRANQVVKNQENLLSYYLDPESMLESNLIYES